MYKLWKANIFRLKKDWIFWAFLLVHVGMAFYSVFYLSTSLEKTLYQCILLEGIWMAIFISVFVGRDYASGGIRNKIIAGHSRTSLYITNWLTSVAVGLLGTILHMAIVYMLKSHIAEHLQLPIHQTLTILGNIILLIFLYATIFNSITMLCADITTATILCTFIYIFMFIICSALALTVFANPYITNSYFEDGEEYIIERKPNPQYPDETKKKIATFVYYLLPVGQALDISSLETENIQQYPAYAIPSMLGIGIVSMYICSRKELK